jgi:hypothetical protein
LKIQSLKSKTEVLAQGLTITTWANDNYGHVHLRGLTAEDKVVDITLSTFQDLPVLREALGRLYCSSAARYQDELISICALPRGHEGSHKSDHTGGENGYFAHEWEDEDSEARVSL